jgi:hypothetical protein
VGLIWGGNVKVTCGTIVVNGCGISEACDLESVVFFTSTRPTGMAITRNSTKPIFIRFHFLFLGTTLSGIEISGPGAATGGSGVDEGVCGGAYEG